MKSWWIGALAVLVAETAALACSCVSTDNPTELRRLAAEAARNAVAVVEADTLTAYDPATGAGEQMRVVRTLVGQTPAQFTIERRGQPSSAACDTEYGAGTRAQLILYPASAPSASETPVYRVAGLCSVHLLDKPVFREALLRAMSRRGPSGQRG
jgi:hypothetical protein